MHIDVTRALGGGSSYDNESSASCRKPKQRARRDATSPLLPCGLSGSTHERIAAHTRAVPPHMHSAEALNAPEASRADEETVATTSDVGITTEVSVTAHATSKA